MPDLPARPDLDQLRHQAKDLLRAAKAGDAGAAGRIRAVSDRVILAGAQLAIAREYGFASWPELKSEVHRRALLNARDVDRLRALLDEEPRLAGATMEHWCDHRTRRRPRAANKISSFGRARRRPGSIPARCGHDCPRGLARRCRGLPRVG
jgi:hypothetical protein